MWASVLHTPTICSFIFKGQPFFNGVPDDQIHSKVNRILHTIDTRTGHIGQTRGSFWWAYRFQVYIEEHDRKVSNNNS